MRKMLEFLLCEPPSSTTSYGMRLFKGTYVRFGRVLAWSEVF